MTKFLLGVAIGYIFSGPIDKALHQMMESFETQYPAKSSESSTPDIEIT